MSLAWYFKQWQPGDTPREPIQGEFFATEAIRDSAEALVRESIQNSLDARFTEETARLRFFMSGSEQAVPSGTMAPYLKALWPHLKAKRNGLSHRPSEVESCPFIVVEDFGTTGLQGDPEQWHRVYDQANDFFAFFRAEGVSDKKGSDGGRWGIGKFVFPRSSRVSSFFGLTVRRNDGRRLLLGRSILKSHSIDSEHCVPDGYFGTPQHSGGLILPLEDPLVLERFAKAFRLKRGSQPGLSVVILWPDADITEHTLAEAVLRDYFIPILHGHLEVSIETPARVTKINRGSLAAAVRSAGDAIARDLEPLIQLASWGFALTDEKRCCLAEAAKHGAPEWDVELIDPSDRARLWTSLMNGEPVAVRVPIIVRTKAGKAESSRFDVYLQRTGEKDSGRPVFVREGIMVSDARGAACRGHIALVIVEDKPLASLLGDAENPAHTEWRPDTANFKNKYQHGPQTLRFIKESVASIIRILSDEEPSLDPSLLIDVFSIDVAQEEDLPASQHKQPKKKPGVRPSTQVPPLSRRPQSFRLSRIAGGFTVAPGDAAAQTPGRLDVKVAYDVRRGSPLKRYHPADFAFVEEPIRLLPSPRGLEIVEARENHISLNVKDKDFFLGVVGFDPNRDLFVSVRASEELDGNPTT